MPAMQDVFDHNLTFHFIRIRQNGLLEDLHSEIDQFVREKRTFISTIAGADILESWSRKNEWTNLCGGDEEASQVFGVALFKYLFGRGWKITPIIYRGRPAKRYTRT